MGRVGGQRGQRGGDGELVLVGMGLQSGRVRGPRDG